MSFQILDHLSKLNVLEDQKTQYVCECPICNGRRLTISKPRGAYQCWSGKCELSLIREAVAPLHQSGSPTPFVKVRPKSIAYHQYPSSSGQPLVQVKREYTGLLVKGKPEKKMCQGWWDGSKWQWSGMPDEVKRQVHLYRIFEPINQAAIKSKLPLLVVEGETKVDALHEFGIAATCSIGGAEKWNHYGGVTGNYLVDLTDAVVVVCPDRDPCGIRHAEMITSTFPSAQWLYANPGDPAWDNPSDGYDIGDWIESGATVEQILGAIGDRRATSVDDSQTNNTAPPEPPEYQDFLKKVEALMQYEDSDEYKFYRVKLARNFGYRAEEIDDLIRRKLTPENKKERRVYDLHELRDMPEFALEWLVPGFLPRGESLLFSAEAKMGKTLLSDDLIFHLITGEDDFLGIGAEPKTSKVLKLSVDESLQSTVLKAEKRYGPTWMEPNHVRLITEWKLTEIDFLSDQIDEWQPDLLVIDSLRQVASSLGISENSAEFVDAITSVIKLCRKKNVSLIIIHHDNKNKESQGIDRARGSSSLPAAFWGILRLDPKGVEVEEGEGKQKKKVTKIDPQSPDRLLTLTARDVAPMHLHIELELESHHWINHGDYGSDNAGLAKDFEDRVMSMLRLNPDPLSVGDLIMLMEIESSQKNTLYRVVDKLVAKRLISKVKDPFHHGRGRPKWHYSLPNTPPPPWVQEKKPENKSNPENKSPENVSGVDTNAQGLILNDPFILKNISPDPGRGGSACEEFPDREVDI